MRRKIPQKDQYLLAGFLYSYFFYLLKKNVDIFLTKTFYSYYLDPETYQNTSDEIMSDRNIDTGERYKNIYELRLVKNKYLIEKMPKLVKNYWI